MVHPKEVLKNFEKEGKKVAKIVLPYEWNLRTMFLAAKQIMICDQLIVFHS